MVIDPYAGYKDAVRDLAPPGDPRGGPVPHPAPRRASAHRGALPTPDRAHRPPRSQRRPAAAVRRDLLRARQHLTAAAWERLDAAFRADCWDEVECAWTLKEMLADLYANPDRPAAEAALADWHHHAGAFDVAETNRLARTLRAWEPELLAYFDRRLTTKPRAIHRRPPTAATSPKTP